MLKSMELRREIDELTASIKDKISNQLEVTADEHAQLQALMDEYKSVKSAEDSAKKINVKGEKTMDNAKFKAALKSFLCGKNDELVKEYFDNAAGNNGAVTADGGALVPSELLGLAENNGVAADLRNICTVIPVSTRTGSVPTIDYGQTMVLTAFDENNAITEKKAAFASVPFTLASKGAIVPVSRELLWDANADVLAVIGKLFNKVYMNTVNGAVLTAATTGLTAITAATAAAAIDKVKEAVIGLPLASAGKAHVVMNQATYAKLALAKDGDNRYLLARDANNATIPMIEGAPVVVCEAKDLANDTIVVGDFSAIYHVENPGLEIMSSEEAGFAKNSVLVRIIARFADINTYAGAFAKITISA